MGVVIPFDTKRERQRHDLVMHIADLDAQLAAFPPYEEWEEKTTRERVVALADERHRAAEMLAQLQGDRT